MAERFPGVFSHSFENIDAKLKGLAQRGFDNPQKMTQSFPAVLGLSFENIDAKLKLLEKVTRLYNAPYTPQQLMEKRLNLFSTKIDKLVVLTRVLRELSQSAQEISLTDIDNVLFSNLENILVAINRLPEGQKITLKELLDHTKSVKAEQISKEEKREEIEQGLSSHPKIQRRYLRGYP